MRPGKTKKKRVFVDRMLDSRKNKGTEFALKKEWRKPFVGNSRKSFFVEK